MKTITVPQKCQQIGRDAYWAGKTADETRNRYQEMFTRLYVMEGFYAAQDEHHEVLCAAYIAGDFAAEGDDEKHSGVQLQLPSP